MVVTPTNGYQSAVCRNKLRACFKGRTEGCPPAVNRGLACRNRRHSPSVYCLLMLTCTQPSSLASLSARQSRATPSSGSSSYGAPIILSLSNRHQPIVALTSAFSADRARVTREYFCTRIHHRGDYGKVRQ
jgi:hypothetical protein